MKSFVHTVPYSAASIAVPRPSEALHGRQQPPQSPFKMLQLPPEFRGGAFDTTFADEDLRVSRGDRGELRVFVRA